VSERGFTLIEVVAAVAILAVVMSLLMGSVVAQQRVGQAAGGRVEMDQLARLVMEQMGRDLVQVLLPDTSGQGEPPLIGEPEIIDRREGYRLSLLTRAGGVEPVVRAVYETRPASDEADGPLVIYRTEESTLSQGQAREEILCRRVGGLEIYYQDQRGEESNEWRDKQKLPRTVRIELGLVQEDGWLVVYQYTAGPLAGLAWKRSR